MNKGKSWSVVFRIAVGCAVLVPLARASERDELTEVTFKEQVEIPGHVLPAGSYWFVREPDQIEVVRIFSLDWKTLYATELTAAAERLTPAEETTFTFARRESSGPEVLVKWFYPGRTIGHEFLYPKQEERELAHAEQQTVVMSAKGASRTHPGF